MHRLVFAPQPSPGRCPSNAQDEQGHVSQTTTTTTTTTTATTTTTTHASSGAFASPLHRLSKPRLAPLRFLPCVLLQESVSHGPGREG